MDSNTSNTRNTTTLPLSVGPLDRSAIELLARKAYETDTGESFNEATPQDRQNAILAAANVLQNKPVLADVPGGVTFGKQFASTVLKEARQLKGWDEDQYSRGFQAQYAGDTGSTDRGNIGIGSQQEQGGMHAGGSNVRGAGVHGDPPSSHR